MKSIGAGRSARSDRANAPQYLCSAMSSQQTLRVNVSPLAVVVLRSGMHKSAHWPPNRKRHVPEDVDRACLQYCPACPSSLRPRQRPFFHILCVQSVCVGMLNHPAT